MNIFSALNTDFAQLSMRGDFTTPDFLTVPVRSVLHTVQGHQQKAQAELSQILSNIL